MTHPTLTMVIASKAVPSKTLRMIFSEIDEPSLGFEVTFPKRTDPTSVRNTTLVRNPAC